MATMVYDGINPFNRHVVVGNQLFGSYKDNEEHGYKKSTPLDLSRLPPSLKTINSFCFANNKRIVEYVSAPSLEVIRDHAFTNSSIKKVAIGDKLGSIGYHSFTYCTALEEVSLSGYLISFRDEAFAYCKNLRKVVIKGRISMPRGVFIGCDNLEEFHIEDMGAHQFQSLILPKKAVVYAKRGGRVYSYLLGQKREVKEEGEEEMNADII